MKTVVIQTSLNHKEYKTYIGKELFFSNLDQSDSFYIHIQNRISKTSNEFFAPLGMDQDKLCCILDSELIKIEDLYCKYNNLIIEVDYKLKMTSIYLQNLIAISRSSFSYVFIYHDSYYYEDKIEFIDSVKFLIDNDVDPHNITILLCNTYAIKFENDMNEIDKKFISYLNNHNILFDDNLNVKIVEENLEVLLKDKMLSFYYLSIPENRQEKENYNEFISDYQCRFGKDSEEIQELHYRVFKYRTIRNQKKTLKELFILISFKTMMVNLQEIAETITIDDLITDLTSLEEDIKTTNDKKLRRFIKQHIKEKQEQIKKFHNKRG